MDTINGFRGEYHFLSNFYPCRITFYGLTFTSVEAAFQAAKCADPQQRKSFCDLSAADAKRLGRSVALRQDWEQRKLTIMHNLLVHKFYENPELLDKLLATGTAPLVESNTWHDNFWGNCTCSRCSRIDGRSTLGRLLMEIRSSFEVKSHMPSRDILRRCPRKKNLANCYDCPDHLRCGLFRFFWNHYTPTYDAAKFHALKNEKGE